MDFIILSSMPVTFWQRGLGAYQVAHHLRTFGYTCQVIEFTQFFSSEELIQMVEKFITPKTLALGVSTTWLTKETRKDPIRSTLTYKPNLPDNIIAALEHIKNNYPTIKRIAGGAVTKRYKNDPLFDYTFTSYCEDSILKLFNELSGKTEFQPFNIETLQHRYTDQDVILPGETLPIEISRGCIFKCSFCSFPLNGKKKLDYIRNPRYIVDEMVYNYEKFGTTNYLFTDDTFNDTTTKLLMLHKEITALPFKINFICYLRIDLLYAHREQIKLLKEMGLRICAFGIETFHPEAAKAVGKGMPAEKIKAFLQELYDRHWGYNIRIHCYMMSGLPGESLQSAKDSMDWLHSRPFSSFFTTFSLYENSEDKSKIASQPNKYGYQIDMNGKWYTDIHTQEQSETFHTRHFALMVKRGIPYEGFHLMGAWKHYGVDESMKLTWRNVVERDEEIHNEKLQYFEEYKKKLLAL